MTHKGEKGVDFSIPVKHEGPLPYPNGARPIYPQFEGLSPQRFNLREDVEPWFFPGQNGGSVRGSVIWEHLQSNKKELSSHLGLVDLLAIQAKLKIVTFRELFPQRGIYAWRSVAKRDDTLFVPGLCSPDGTVSLMWFNIVAHGWGPYSPALRFRDGLVKN